MKHTAGRCGQHIWCLARLRWIISANAWQCISRLIGVIHYRTRASDYLPYAWTSASQEVSGCVNFFCCKMDAL
jgi:hypothetical protein